MRRWLARRAVLALAPAVALAAAVGCRTPGPALEQRTYAPPAPALSRVAVIPFYAHRTYEGSNLIGSVAAEDATARVTRHVAEALTDAGVAVVPEGEVVAVVAGMERRSAAADAPIAAALAARQLGATAIVVGEVMRYRESRGASKAGRQPASVAYQITLYETPDAYRLWSARFDETQVSTAGLGQGEPDEPKAGVAWKSAAEISRWGAASIAKALVEHP